MESWMPRKVAPGLSAAYSMPSDPRTSTIRSDPYSGRRPPGTPPPLMLRSSDHRARPGLPEALFEPEEPPRAVRERPREDEQADQQVADPAEVQRLQATPDSGGEAQRLGEHL